MSSGAARFSILFAAVLSASTIIASTQAAVSGVSVSESVSTSIGVSQPSGPPLTDSDSQSSAVFPPTSLNVTSTVGAASNFATLTIDSYSGPMSAGDITTGLTLVGAIHVVRSMGGNISSTEASTSFQYRFSLNVAQPYTLTNTDFGTVDVFGPDVFNFSTVVPPGSGILQPGEYLLSAFVPNGLLFPNGDDGFFNLVVAAPEPGSCAMGFSLAALASLPRRRPRRR